jgi:hypothetical protein
MHIKPQWGQITMPKIKIDSDILGRAKNVADSAGYSSVEEFILHAIETALVKYETSDEDDKDVAERLRGLGYIE